MVIEAKDHSGVMQFVLVNDVELEIPGVNEPLKVLVKTSQWNPDGHCSLTFKSLTACGASPDTFAQDLGAIHRSDS
jgi:hypothetical protein